MRARNAHVVPHPTFTGAPPRVHPSRCRVRLAISRVHPLHCEVTDVGIGLYPGSSLQLVVKAFLSTSQQERPQVQPTNHFAVLSVSRSITVRETHPLDLFQVLLDPLAEDKVVLSSHSIRSRHFWRKTRIKPFHELLGDMVRQLDRHHRHGKESERQIGGIFTNGIHQKTPTIP